MTKAESNQNRRMQFPDINGITGKVSKATLMKNIPRAILEFSALVTERTDPERIAQHVGHVAILLHAEDPLFPQDGFKPALQRSADIALAEIESNTIGYLNHASVAYLNP